MATNIVYPIPSYAIKRGLYSPWEMAIETAFGTHYWPLPTAISNDIEATARMTARVSIPELCVERNS